MMRKTLYIIAALVLATVMMTSCHSNEKNYREAYEKAIERRQTGIGAETYAMIEAERVKYTTIIDGDSVRLLYIHANVAIDTTDVASDFNIVVASFSQRINAKSYRDRLREECGLKGSYVLYSASENLFYVVAQGYDDKVEAVRFMRDIDQRVCLKILEPIPWILRKL
ncbi:MAG: SPOR domain-containing protein [Muribaculaceae bacterium]|nr:SPOR domain-containing protein [Muribaculaceae bacterium]